MVRFAAAAASIVLLAASPPPGGSPPPGLAAAAACTVAPGAQVALRSSELDPDVFVWDSRERVLDYAAGYWRDTKDVVAHSLLAKPGTRATVVRCYESAVSSRYVNARQDLLAVRIVSGPNRGRYGWITSEDVSPASR